MNAVAQRERDRRTGGQAPRAQDGCLPPLDRPERSEHGAHDREAACRALDDDPPLLGERCEEVEVDACGNCRELAGESLLGSHRRLFARGEQRVDPGQKPVALVAPRRVAEALGIDERRDRRRLGLEEGDVGEAGDSGVEAVHHVEVAAAERSRDVGADPDGDPDCRAGRDGHRAGECDDAVETTFLQCPPTCEQLLRPQRRGEDDDVVSSVAERVGQPVDVLVRVVRHGPRVRGHEADAKRHGPRL